MTYISLLCLVIIRTSDPCRRSRAIAMLYKKITNIDNLKVRRVAGEVSVDLSR